MDHLVIDLQEKLSEQFVNFNDVTSNTTSASHDKDLEKPLIVKRTVCYIVCAVIIEKDEVLMMKEAKDSCRGLWYLPAGRVEKNETLVDAVKREVLEETGLNFEPSNLVSIEGPTLDWIRFTFTGKITGGKVKTIEQQDKESLEAGWYSAEGVLEGSLPLRANDICPLIKYTIAWNKSKKTDPIFSIVPRLIPHSRNRIQLILISQEQNGMKVLIDRESGMKFLEITSTFSRISVRETADMLVKRALADDYDVNIIGVVRVEQSGGPHGVSDGTSLTLLAKLITPLVKAKSRYMWCSVSDENLETKLMKLCEKGCVELK